MAELTPKQKRDQQRDITRSEKKYEIAGTMSTLFNKRIAYDRLYKTPITEGDTGGARGVTTRVSSASPTHSKITLPLDRKLRSFSPSDENTPGGRTMEEMMDSHKSTMNHEMIHVLQNMVPDQNYKSLSKLRDNNSAGKRLMRKFQPTGYDGDEFEAYLLSDTAKDNPQLNEALGLGTANRHLTNTMERMLEYFRPSPRRELEEARNELLNTYQPGHRKIIENMNNPRRLQE